MQAHDKSKSAGQPRHFAVEASGARAGLVYQLWLFLRANKKWWLAPLLLMLLLFGVLLVLGETAVAPFIYTLF